MKNNLFLTTALVATTFVAGNAMAEYLEIHSGAISQETADYTSDHDTSDTRISFVKTGEESQVDVELTGDVAMGTYVTLHDKTNITSDDEGTKTLTVSGYLTETAAGSDISGVDLKMQKGSVKNSEAETVEEGELVLGNNLKVGNVNMTNGTGIFSLGDTEKTLTVAEDKVLTFEGNNYITSNANGALTIGGAVVNNGDLTIKSAVAADSLENSGNVILQNTFTGNILGSEVTLNNGGKLAGNIIGADDGKAAAVNIDLGTTTSGEGDDAVTVPASGTLSDLITGDIISAEVLNVNSGSVTFDKAEADLGSVNVAEGAALAVNTNINATVTNNGQLSATAGLIKDTVTNNGIYEMGAGTLAANVEGTGTIVTSGDVVIADADPEDEESVQYSIANDVKIGDASSLNANADNVKGAVEILENGTYDVTGGTIANAVSGEGTLSISGNVNSDAVLSAANVDVAGSLTTDAGNLASAVANSGKVNLTGGTLTQAISGGTTNIKGNVALGQDVSISTAYVDEGATLDAGTNTLTGNVTFADGSNLAFNADGSNDTVINGTANLEGNVAVNATYAAGVNSSLVKIADIDGESAGQFTVTGNNLYNVSIDEEGNLVAEKKSGSEIVASTGANSNEAGTIAALTSATSNNPILNNIINNVNEMLQSNNAGDVRVALDAVTALAPEVTPVAQQTQTENINQVFGAISTRMSGGSVASRAEGKSSGDELFENGAMWVQMLYNHADKDNTRKAKGYKADSTGVAFGFEKQINDAVKAGIGYAYTKTDVDGFKRDTDIDTHTAFVYGEYKPSPWFVNAVASYNWSDYDEKKYVFNNKVTAGYDVESFGLQAMTGYDMNLCNGTIFTPEAGLRYVHMMQDGYKDKAGQYVYGNDSDLLTGVVGAKISHDFELENGWNLRPEFRLAATYDISSDDGNSLVSLANGSAYSVKGEKLDRLGMEAELGITADVTDDVSVSLGYQGRFRDHYEDHTGLINAKFKF